jgi:hypothetical protein
MSTRELVDALISGDSIAIENTFNAAMSDKVSAALDSYRVQVATKMFVKPEENNEQLDVNTNDA